MASALELMGIKINPESTHVSAFGIDNDIAKLEAVSKTFFTITDEGNAADSNVLAVTFEPSHTFELSNSAHIDHLNNCTRLFKEKSKQLKQLDQKIMTGIAVGVVASTFSFLPFVGYFTVIGFGGAAYYAMQRQTAYNEYHRSLNLLVATCNWSLGTAQQGVVYTGTQLDGSNDGRLAITNMMTALYPVLTEAQVKHLLADEIENAFVAQKNEFDSRPTQSVTSMFNLFRKSEEVTSAEKIAMSKKSAEFNRCVYGYNKGNASDFLDAVLSIVPDLYKAASHAFNKAKKYCFGETESSTNQAMSASA